MPEFFFPLPEVPPQDRERFYGCWAAMAGRRAPPMHERIFKLWFIAPRADGIMMPHVAEVGEPLRPGEPPVVMILPGDPLVVYRLHDGAFAVPAHRACDAEYFE